MREIEADKYKYVNPRSGKPTVEELERLLAVENGPPVEITSSGEVMPGGLLERIRAQLNAVSAENGSNTPDFILAEYLVSCLAAYERAVNARERWHGRTVGADG